MYIPSNCTSLSYENKKRGASSTCSRDNNLGATHDEFTPNLLIFISFNYL